MTTDRLTQNKHLVDAFIQELFTKGDLEAVDRYLDPSFVNHDAPFPGAPEGREGMRLAASAYRQALPDWHSDVEQLIAEGDIVVEIFTASGTHSGELMGVLGTGKRSPCRASTCSASRVTTSLSGGATSTNSGCSNNSAWSRLRDQRSSGEHAELFGNSQRHVPLRAGYENATHRAVAVLHTRRGRHGLTSVLSPSVIALS